MDTQHFDTLGVATIDFATKEINSFEIHDKFKVKKNPELYFDLASITKVMTLASSYLIKPDIFSKEMLLLLEHRAGLPFWGRLSRDSWRETVNKYEIKESPTEYSDFSALRLQCEIEKRTNKPLYDLCSVFWDKEVCHWRDIPMGEKSPITGTRSGKLIKGQVHDDNAFVIGERLGHAGLFATLKGISQSFLNLDKDYNLIEKMGEAFDSRKDKGRFLYGWDTVTDPEKTLAGQGCSSKTFGHLGFTGNSIWIDSVKKKALVILSNGCNPYWYHRDGLNSLRRSLGQIFWEL